MPGIVQKLGCESNKLCKNVTPLRPILSNDITFILINNFFYILEDRKGSEN